MSATPAVHYRIVPSHPQAHLFESVVIVERPDSDGQLLAMPAWIPGSYMIREYARHVVRIEARCGRRPVRIEKVDKHTWRAAPCDGPLTVTCEIYAWDLSVRGAHLDETHGFFNGTCVFLRPVGRDEEPVSVEIRPPRGAHHRRWQVATALAPVDIDARGYGRYRAADYDELIDHPVEMGTFTRFSFAARGVPHEVAITGRHDADTARMAEDLRRMAEAHIDFFGGTAPMDRYVFLVTVVGEGYGGLEHRASTALLCRRDDLPRRGDPAPGDGYRTFLGLASHEYFHTWNVKRIKPAAFLPYDLTRENHTRLLWAFEGITSYYDDLALVRAGLMTPEQYLAALAGTVTAVQRGSGRLKQTLEASSWDAWIKYYRPDENTPNAVVSYYAKGALAALALDLHLRSATGGRRSLDDVMRALWTGFGSLGRGVGEGEIEALAERVSGLSLRRFFDRALRSTRDLPLRELLAEVGIDLHLRAAESEGDRGGTPPAGGPRRARPVLGVRTERAGDDLRLTHVLDGGAAQEAGLSAGDVLIAIDGLRVGAGGLERALAAHEPGRTVKVHAFRRDELIERRVRLQPAPADTAWLALRERPSARQRRLREAWLAGRGPVRRARRP